MLQFFRRNVAVEEVERTAVGVAVGEVSATHCFERCWGYVGCGGVVVDVAIWEWFALGIATAVGVRSGSEETAETANENNI